MRENKPATASADVTGYTRCLFLGGKKAGDGESEGVVRAGG